MPEKQIMLIQKGYERAKQKRIIFAGLCRSAELSIRKNITMCQTIGKLFDQYKIILFENDSKDNTRGIIKEMTQSDPNIILLDCGPDNPDCKFQLPDLYNMGSLSKNRMNKMAQLRNRYLTFIKEHYHDYDYLLVLDMDLSGYTNIDGIMHSIGKNNWDIIAANGRTGFIITSFTYDALSYARNDAGVTKCKIGSSNYLELAQKLIRMNIMPKDFVPVRSAFNGMCLYRIKSILKSTYGLNYCNEHIAFNDNIWKNGYRNIYINPFWIVYAGTQGSTFINTR